MDVYEYVYNESPIGFTQFLIDEQFECKGSLGGLYKGSNVPGGGLLVRYVRLRKAAACGAKRAISHVSTNNSRSMRINIALGYQYEETHYVYIKHI
jgi:hypothetical protein